MRVRLWARIGLVTCVAAFAGTAHAMDPNREMSQYVHERWGTEQGFPPGPVYAITQSSDGYLWIGTQAGLVRFDGLSFRLIRDVPGLLNNESVLGLTPDRDGNLWVRLEGSIVRYRDGVFSGPASDSALLNSRISAMSQANLGEPVAYLMDRGVILHRQGRFELVADASGLPRSPVLSVAQTTDGSIWAGTRGAGLFRVRQRQTSSATSSVTSSVTSSITQGLPDLKVNCLLADVDDNLWVGTDSGIARWNGSRIDTLAIPASFQHLQILALLKDRDANIWVGTDAGGLLRLNAQGASSLDNGEGRSHEAVTAMFEDREGSLWIGSDSGIERLRDSTFVTYSLPEGLPTDGSNPVFVDSQNRMWFSPVDGGLWWVKNGQHGRVTEAGLDKDVVYSIAGSNGELWLGRQHHGLTRLRVDKGSFNAKTYTQADGLAQDSVYSVYTARDGSVWAGTLSGGVSKLTGETVKTYTTANGLASNTVASILESADGTTWFATPNGLSSLSKDRWQTYRAKDGLPSENLNCLMEDSSGVLWVGTAAGLAFRDSHGFRVPAGLPSALHEQILGMAEDRFGWLWMSTSGHVLRVKRDRLIQGVLSDGDIREFGLADGLRGTEGVKRHQSVVTDPLGRMWFSLNHGISSVDPARLARNSAPVIVHLLTISADNSAIGLGGSVHIPGGRQRITFGFTGLSLTSPERVRFRYQLEGFDRGWSEPTASREAIYTNPSPGPYRFRVVASNADGVWSGDEAAIGLRVEPLYWQTWWFIALFVLTCTLAIAAIYRMRLHQLARRLNIRFEERLAERTRIAQELHDTLLQGFLSASMQVHVASDHLPADSPMKPTLTRALQLMGQVIDEGRNAVHGLRSTQSMSLDLEQALSRIPGEMVPAGQDGGQIDFRIVVSGERRPLQPALRDEVYRIAREAIINAFRHARARSIEVGLSYSANYLRLMVRDDGCGIDPQVVHSGREGHWGLSGMRERAEGLGARLRVFSSGTAGTEIELSVPGRVAFDRTGRDARPQRNRQQ